MIAFIVLTICFGVGFVVGIADKGLPAKRDRSWGEYWEELRYHPAVISLILEAMLIALVLFVWLTGGVESPEE